jgi:hypothetical protein
MNIFQKLFPRKKGKKKGGRKPDGDDPGYLACPIVAAELKRGKFDSGPEDKPISREDSGEKGEKNSAGEKS